MYECISQELVAFSQSRRYLGDQSACRYCGTVDRSAFGNKTNAHTFPQAFGNRVLFSLDECKQCNGSFSVYEDALSKAVGPFLTLGGVKGKNGVRGTGRSEAASKIRHSSDKGRRRISITSSGSPNDLVKMDSTSKMLSLRMPVQGDKFVPLYAYKALLKMAMAVMPKEELSKFKTVKNCLLQRDHLPHSGPLLVGFSCASVGDAPPTLAGTLLRRSENSSPIPYAIFLFAAGSVCFQIWVRSDEMDSDVPTAGSLGIEFNLQLPVTAGQSRLAMRSLTA